ncbi:MFS transporter [Paenarthrobacter sp. 2TAF44]|uniref:MFS transporter n=1 Tax=Paenarthrobacter sp. 2TAF44 TaxID=3233018 RepID=UPI003F979D4E
MAAFFLTMLQRLGGAGTFAVFGVLAILGFMFVRKFAPETKGRPLEEIQQYWENRGKWPEAEAAGQVPPQEITEVAASR